jgi:hypothetical protein
MANATEFANKLDLDLMVARRTGEVVVLLIPYGQDYTTALDFGQWLVGRLRTDRDLRPTAHPAQTPVTPTIGSPTPIRRANRQTAMESTPCSRHAPTSRDSSSKTGFSVVATACGSRARVLSA